MLGQGNTARAQAPEILGEQRSEPRYEDIVERAVITFRGRDYPASVVNISARGTQLEADIMPRMGESLIIQFENCSRMHGFVRWVREEKLGIRFGHEIILAS
jgi:hypothetical protein